MTDRPCWQGAATIRCESDLSFIAVQGAHGLLNGGTLHSAAVHAENWGANRGTIHHYVSLHFQSPNETGSSNFCSLLASWKPCLSTGIFISINVREL